MAFVKVGKQYLDEQEYESYKLGLWRLSLFLLVFVLLKDNLPSDWPKTLRFVAMMSLSYMAAFIVSSTAEILRTGFYMIVFCVFTSLILYGLWVCA